MEQQNIEEQQETQVIFYGKAGEFFSIWIVNILLSIITLGIYSAWAKVRTHRYFYGNTGLGEDRFEYHATPMQILKGRLVAVLVVTVWFISSEFLNPVIGSIVVLGFYLALPWLLWANARFDSAMTSYRNVRFAFTARLIDAYKALLGRAILVFGLLAGIMVWLFMSIEAGEPDSVLRIFAMISMFAIGMAGQVWIIYGSWKYFMNGYQYGDLKVTAELKLGRFFKIYLMAGLLGLVLFIAMGIAGSLVFFGGSSAGTLLNFDLFSQSIGSFAFMALIYIATLSVALLVSSYIVARTRNYVYSCAELKNDVSPIAFKSDLSASGYGSLVVTNFLAQIVSVGLARPWVKVRTARYLAQHTFVLGDINTTVASQQNQEVKSSVGDEVAQAFDVGIGIN